MRTENYNKPVLPEKMNINLTIKKKPTALDEYLDNDEMELPPFHFALVELSQYVEGCINITFSNGFNITLDLFCDFLICLDDIIDSINAAKSLHEKIKEIWFCEQGSDFYLYYQVKNKAISLSYKKGKSVGMPNKAIPDFLIEVSTSEYITQWENIFQKLIMLFEEILDQKIRVPF
ncbi:hypothetical protein [Gilliamella sp. App6-5]|uniref:hypothetical protein n=1 Tax=Gilliamella sp. App6-5 TaxID=3120232 RepID=UPI001C3FFEA2|nr:hypothetical protein [Gilliamella apicola]